MEPESPGLRSGRLKNGDKAQTESSSQKRRGSTGSNSPKFKRVQRSRHSWHDTSQTEHGYQTRRKSLEVNIKKRKADIEERDENPQTEALGTNPENEEDLCKKTLQEAILKLNKDVDLQACTLLDLVYQISSLAEDRENMVKKLSEKSAEDGEKMSNLEEILHQRKLEIDSLSSEKNQLEALLKEEQDKSISIENQLKEALAKVEQFSKEVESYVNKESDCDSEILPVSSETIAVPEEMLTSEDKSPRTENCTLQTKEEDEIDAKLKEALNKFAVLVHENKRLESKIHLHESNRVYVQKFNERFVKLEEKFKKNKADLLGVSSGEEKMRGTFKVDRVSNDLQCETSLEEDNSNKLIEQQCEDNKKTEIKHFEEGESLEKKLYSKVNILEHLYKISELCNLRFQQEIKRTEELNNEINKLDSLFKDLEQTISKVQKENDNLSLLLEKERQKFSSLELTLAEKDKALQKQKKETSSETENEVKELINRVADLNAQMLETEEGKITAQCEMKKCKAELIGLETQLEECKKQVLSLTSSNEELQLLVMSENKSSQEVKCQLQIALEKVETLTREISDLSETYRSKEEELLKCLNEETNKVIKLGDEIHSKTVALENLNVMMEEYKMQLSEERGNYKSMEKRLNDLLEKEPISREINTFIDLEEYVEEIMILMGQLELCHVNLFKVNIENNSVENPNSRESNSFYTDAQLQPFLEIIRNVSSKMSKLSEKLNCKDMTENKIEDSELKETESQPSLSLESIKEESLNVTASDFVEVNLHIKEERLSLGESMLMECKEAIDCSVAYNDKEISREGMMGSSLSADLEGKISSLEAELERTKIDLETIMTERNELELLLKEETGKSQDSEKELKNALNEIDILSKKLKEAKCNNEIISAQLSEEMGRYRQLEDELEANEVVVANLAESEEECILQLKEMAECKQNLEGDLQEARETISKLREENKKLNNEMVIREEGREAAGLQNREEISKLEAIIQSQLQDIGDSSKGKEEIQLEKMAYKERISELENVVEENMSAISKLGIEKGKLETILETEKENCQKTCLQLTEALAYQENMTLKINEYETKITELKDFVARNELVLSTLGSEKVELESLLILEKENCQKMNSQLNEASVHVETLMGKLSVFEKILVELEHSTEKIAAYEREIANLKELKNKNESEISSLGIEKARLESLLILENENSQAISLQLSETSSELEKFSAKIQEYEKKILEFEELVIANESAMFQLVSEKDDLESNLISEKENCLKLSSQLNEVSSNFEDVQKESNESCIKKDTEELTSLLYTEIQKVEKLQRDIETKNNELMHMKNKEQELMMLLDAEKCRNQDLEQKSLRVQAEDNKEVECSGNSSLEKKECSDKEESEKIAEFKIKVLELEDVIVRLHIEKEELESILVSEKGNSRRMSSQLSEALLNLENVSKGLSESSAKQEVEELSSTLESKSQEIISLKEEIEIKVKESEELRGKLEEPKREELEKMLGYEKKIFELEESLAKNEHEYLKICSEKNKLELMLASEKENQQKTALHLSEAMITLDNITAAMIKSSEGEEVSLLEEKLKAEKEKVENLTSRLKELTFDLSQEKSKHEQLQEKLQNLESDSNFGNSHEDSNLDGELCSHATTLEKIYAYERKIVELGDTVSNNASEISRLCGEKVELESLLAQEKENRRKIYSELNVALINLDNVTERINEHPAGNKDVEELSSLLDIEMQKVKTLEEELESKEENLENLVSKLDELSECLSEEKSKEEQLEAKLQKLLAKGEHENITKERMPEVDSCCDENMSEEICDLDNEKAMTEKSLVENEQETARISVENEEIQPQTLTEESQNISLQLSEALANLENASAKILAYEKVIGELKDRAAVDSTEISKLGKEKGEIESKLVMEQEKFQKTSEQLSAALVGLQNASEKTMGYEKKIHELVELAEKNAFEISKVFNEKGKIELQIILEKEKFNNVSLQLSEAVVKLESEATKVLACEKFIEEMKQQAELNASSRLEKEKEVDSQLMLEKQNLKKTSLQLKQASFNLKTQSEILLAYEATIDQLKEQADKNASEISELVKERQQMELQLMAEKEKYEDMSNQSNKASVDLENESAKMSEYEKIVEELKDRVDANAHEISRLRKEKSEIEMHLDLEKEKLEQVSFQLSEALINLKNESAKASAYEKLVEDMKQQGDWDSSEMSTLEKEKGEIESQLILEKEKYQSISLQLSEALASLESESDDYEKVVKEWKDAAEVNASEISRLCKEKNEIEYQLNHEKENFQYVSLQLSEAVLNLEEESKKVLEYEALIEELKKQVELKSSEILSIQTEKAEAQLMLEKENLQNVTSQLSEAVLNLQEESKKVFDCEALIEEMKGQVELKSSEILSLGTEKAETEAQLMLEKENLQNVTSQLSEAVLNLERESKKVLEYETLIEEMKGQVELKSSEILSLGTEKAETEAQLMLEKENLQNVTSQLSEAELNLQGESKKVFDCEALIEEMKGQVELKSSEILSLVTEKAETEAQLMLEKENLQNVTSQLSEAELNLQGESRKVFDCEALIEEMKGQVELKSSEILSLVTEKAETEAQLMLEKENLQNVASQLSEAVLNLERESKKVLEYETLIEEMKGQVELKSSEILILQKEKVEAEAQLILEKENLQNVTSQLSEAVLNLQGESKRVFDCEALIEEMKGQVELKSSEIVSLETEKAETEAQLMLEKENLQNVTSQLNEAVLNLEGKSKKVLEYETLIEEMKGQVELKSSEILILQKEKVEAEAQLILEKENLQNVTSQLSEEVLNLEGESKKMLEYEALIKELKRLIELKSSEIVSLETEKAETEAQLILEKENLQKVTSQLNEAVLNLEGESKKLLEYEALIKELKGLIELKSSEIVSLQTEKAEFEAHLMREKENLQNVTSQLNEALVNLQNESAKVLSYEKDIEGLKEQADIKTSEICMLGKEKEEIVSQLVLEKENSYTLSVQLNEALINIENLARDLNYLSSNNKKAEEISSLLEVEVQKVKQLEEELTLKDENLKKYRELQTQLLNEERNKVVEFEKELEKLSTQKEECCLEFNNQIAISENKDLEIKDLLAKVSSYEEEVKRLTELETKSSSTVSDHVERISELENLIEEGKRDIAVMMLKNKELEINFNSEKENSEVLNLQLKDAMEKIENLLHEIENLSDICKNKEEEIQSNKLTMEKLFERHDWKSKEGREWFEVVDEEMDQILMQVSILTQEKESLTAEHKQENEIHSKEMERLRALLEESESHLSNVTSENEELLVSIEEKGVRLNSIQNQLDSALQEIELITKKLNELSGELKISQNNESETFKLVKAELESTKCALSERTKNEKELINLLEREKQRVEELEKQLLDEEARREEVVNKNEEMTNSMNAIKQQLQSTVNDYEKSSENELKLMAMNEKLSAEFEVQKNRLNSSEIQVERLEAELNAKASKNLELENKNKEADRQIKLLETWMEENKSELSRLSLERERLAEDLHLKDGQLKDIHIQLVNAQQEVGDVKAKLEEECMNLKNKEEEGSGIIKSLRDELENTKYALSVCASSEEDLDKCLKMEKDRVNILSQQLSEEKSKMEELTSKNLELSNSLEGVNQKLSLILEEQTKSDERERDLKSTSEKLSAEVDKLKVSLDSSELQLANLKEELLSKANDVLAIEKKNVELLEHTELLKNLVEQGKSETNNLKEEKNNLVLSVDTKTKEIESVQEQLDRALFKIDTLKNELTEVSKQLETKKIESKRMSSIISELENAKSALVVHAKNEDELNLLVIAEKTKVDELSKKLKEEMLKNTEVLNKNLELTSAVHQLEKQLTVFLGENKLRSEKETNLLATVEELSSKIKDLEDGLRNAKSLHETLVTEVKVKSNKIAVSENKNSELSSLVESCTRKISELEVKMKEVNEKLNSKTDELSMKEKKILQLQTALEKAEGRISSLSSETELLKKQKESENLLTGKVSQLEAALREANDSIKSMTEANIIELETVKRNGRDSILELKDKISTANKELTDVKRASEIRISTLQKELNLEHKKYKTTMEELAVLQLSKAELFEKLKDEKNRVATLESKLTMDGDKFNGLKQKLETAKTELREQIMENYRMKTVEKELKSSLEMGRRKAVTVESELAQMKASLLSSSLKQDELKSEVLRLEAKIQQETASKNQLSSELEIEKNGHASAKEAEKRALQELSLLRKGEEGDVQAQLLRSQIHEKDRQIDLYKKELLRCKQLIYGGMKGQQGANVNLAKKIDCGVQTIPAALPQPESSELHLLQKKIKQLENDKEFLKTLCQRRHKQREELKSQLAAMSGASQSVKKPENKENVNLNV